MNGKSKNDWLFASIAGLVVGAFFTASMASAFGLIGAILGGAVSIGVANYAFYKSMTVD